MEKAASQRQSHREDRQHGDHTHYKTPATQNYARLRSTFPAPIGGEIATAKDDFRDATQSTRLWAHATPTMVVRRKSAPFAGSRLSACAFGEALLRAPARQTSRSQCVARDYPERSRLSLRACATFPSCDTRPTSPFDAPTLGGFCRSLDFIPLEAEGTEPG